MKPLQTLDHVMLWIARAFAALILSYGLYELFYALSASDIRLRKSFLVETACLQTALGFFYLTCLFSIEWLIARLLLGLTAGFFLLRNTIFLFSFFFTIRFHIGDWLAVLFVVATTLSAAVHVLFILLAILWRGERRHSRLPLSGPTNLVISA